MAGCLPCMSKVLGSIPPIGKNKMTHPIVQHESILETPSQENLLSRGTLLLLAGKSLAKVLPMSIFQNISPLVFLASDCCELFTLTCCWHEEDRGHIALAARCECRSERKVNQVHAGLNKLAFDVEQRQVCGLNWGEMRFKKCEPGEGPEKQEMGPERPVKVRIHKNGKCQG